MKGMLEKFFSPTSVAVIGASHNPTKIGHVIFKNFLERFGGRVYPINVDTSPILGRKVYASIKDVKDKVDLAIIAIRAEAVPEVLEECGEKGVKACVIISGGFSEIGRKDLEEKCKRIAKKYGMRVIGPNTAGIYDAYSGVDAMFFPENRMKRPNRGKISFFSQSGAVGSTFMDLMAVEGLGISKFVSYGNAMDVNECDLIEFFGRDKKTEIIAGFLEGVRDGRRFLKVVKQVARKKPVIILKGGKSSVGTRAALSHSASMAGEYLVYSSVFKQTGVIEAKECEEFFDFLKVFSKQKPPKGRRVVIVTNGGGFGVLASDECEKQGLELPEPSDRMKKLLRKVLPPHAVVNNPIDLTGDATAERYLNVLKICMRSKEFDSILLIILLQIPTLGKEIVEFLGKLNMKKPIVCCSAGSEFSKDLIKKVENIGIPVYPTPERAVRALAALTRYAELERTKK